MAKVKDSSKLNVPFRKLHDLSRADSTRQGRRKMIISAAGFPLHCSGGRVSSYLGLERQQADRAESVGRVSILSAATSYSPRPEVLVVAWALGGVGLLIREKAC
jgi:hypothetical protein